jgi:hypothetical protein
MLFFQRMLASLGEAGNPESAKDSVRYQHWKMTHEVGHFCLSSIFKVRPLHRSAALGVKTPTDQSGGTCRRSRELEAVEGEYREEYA